MQGRGLKRDAVGEGGCRSRIIKNLVCCFGVIYKSSPQHGLENVIEKRMCNESYTTVTFILQILNESLRIIGEFLDRCD